MDIKELVNAFNLNNYACGKINTNFTVEGKKIVGLFASGTNTKEYLRGIGEEIIKRHYSGGSEVARKYYNLNYFPFVNSGKEKDIDENVKKVELTDSTNNEVIRNLKIHFVQEFEGAVGGKVIACLQQRVGMAEEEACKCIGESAQLGVIRGPSPYLYYISFSDQYFKEEEYEDPSELLELFKEVYIREFNSRLENCGLKSSDFYEYKNDMLYIKNIGDKVIKSVTKYVKKEVALDFRTPGTEDSKVENFKDVLGDFIFKWTGKPINAYGYDIFADERKIGSGNNFVLIPLTKACDDQLEFLKRKDVYKINIKYKNLMSDIRGKTADPDVNSCENPIYAFSNKGIAQLLPKMMESPIKYNTENKRFEFAADPGNFRRRDSIRGSQSSSTVTSPTRTNSAGSSQLQSPLDSPTPPEPPRTPPEQTGRRFFESRGDSDSGLGDSPPQPKDSVAYSPSGGPESFLKQLRIQGLPRQGSEKEEGEEGPQLLNYVNSVRTSDRPLTQMNATAVNPVISGQSKSGKNLSAAAADEFGTSDNVITSDRYSFTSYLESLLSDFPDFSSNGNSVPEILEGSISSNLGFFAQSPKDMESEESKELQITDEGVQEARGEPRAPLASDESDRESSDECSKAKSQESESPKKHGGKIKSSFSLPFRRNSTRRGSTFSSKSAPATEELPLSTLSLSPPSEMVKDSQRLRETSFVTETYTKSKPETNDSISEFLSQGAVGKAGDRSSKASIDSGIWSLERGQSLPLTEKSSGSSQRKQNILKQFFSAFLSDNGKTTKDILFDEETFSRFSSGMQKVLSLSLSCDMLSNLCRFFPINEHEELIVLARSGKVKKSRSPEEIEQLLSSFSREEKEICSLLFFPEKQNEMCENLSPTAKEQVDLFWTILDERGISGNASTSSKDSGVSLGSSSQKSTSDTGSDEDELEASGGFSQSGRSSVSSNSSTSTVRTQVDSPKTEKHSQEKRKVFA
ncbi:hypothetical protein [Wolbachia endosymbiont (group A) of Anomoia purmunda]|uniref:hypothetical protein n=1 Tax=Wolbachia endosymbiont (group A) of Anomoia purmunda TaxID=2953978 RepID=UPI002232871B|nr:hypothetical protein [Wolbachia endosymbiont (group A) of Anomoia purmunda]